MMFRQSPRRQQRNKGMRVKHVVQVCVLLGACIWLLFYQYQMDHHSSSQHGINLSKKLSDAGDIKLGRKDLKPKAAVAAAGEAQDEKQNAGSQPEGSQPQEAEPEHGGTSPDAKKERPKLSKHNVGEQEESNKKSKHIQDKEEEDGSKEKDEKAEKHKKKSAEKEEPEGKNDNKTKEKEAKEEKESKKKEKKEKNESKKKETKEKNESKEKETKEKKGAAEEKDNSEKASKAGAKKENQGTESEISPNSQQTEAPSNGFDYESSPTTAPADDKKHKMHTMKKISSSSDQNSDKGSSTEAQMDLDTLP